MSPSEFNQLVCNKSIAAVITAADKELICHFCLQTNNAMNNESMSVRTLAGKCERSTKLLKVQMITDSKLTFESYDGNNFFLPAGRSNIFGDNWFT